MKGQITIFNFAVLLLLLAVTSSNGFGQTDWSDSGTFQVSFEGRNVGTEEFSISGSGSGTGAEIIAMGRVSLRLPDGKLELSPRLRARGAGWDPVAYQVDVGGSSPERIVSTIGGGRVSAKIVTASGEQLREYVASSGAVVLDEGVAHHYLFLAARTHQGRVPVIIPRENRQVMATVSSRGEETIKIGGKDVSLFHLVVQPAGGAERHVWVDDENRVYKVETPSRSYKAERIALPTE